MEDKNKKLYEIGYLVREESDKEAVLSLLVSAGAEIAKEGDLRRVQLSYPVKKEKSAVFGFFWFSADPAQIKGIRDVLKLSSVVLRSLIITPPSEGKAERKEVFKGKTSVELKSVTDKPATKTRATAEKKGKSYEVVDTELLEKKLEEILK